MTKNKQATSDYMLAIETALQTASEQIEPEDLVVVVAGTGTYFIEYALGMLEEEEDRVKLMRNLIEKVRESEVRLSSTLH